MEAVTYTIERFRDLYEQWYGQARTTIPEAKLVVMNESLVKFMIYLRGRDVNAKTIQAYLDDLSKRRSKKHKPTVWVFEALFSTIPNPMEEVERKVMSKTLQRESISYEQYTGLLKRFSNNYWCWYSVCPIHGYG